MRDFAAKTKGGLEISVKVIPGSSRSEIVGEFDGLLKVCLNSPPVEGATNKELVKMFSKYFGVPKSQISIIRGEKSRRKLLIIASKSISKLLRLIDEIDAV